MKFGKYLAARQLELPEYSSHFINYKALKKLINALTSEDSTSLQDKKGSFFFRLERELEKVNDFYLKKEAELKFRLDILIQKKTKTLSDGMLSRNSIAFISLYDGFKKFSKDLDRLEQFVELNETGFTKVLKKWDKRSKSSTKELYLSTAVNVQPVFHRNQIVELSDLVANNLMELEAIGDGDKSFIRYEKSDSNTNNENIDIDSKERKTKDNKKANDDYRESDLLYTDFYEITLQNANLPQQEQIDKLKEWSNQVISKLSPNTKKFTLSKVFMLLISNLHIPDDSLSQFYQFFREFIDLKFIDDLNGRTCLLEASTCKKDRNFIVQLCLDSNLDPSTKDVTGRSCLHYITENGRDDLLLLVLSHIENFYKDRQELIIDLQDNESISPLLLAILNNHISSVKILLDYGANGFPSQDDSKPRYLPLNVACKIGNLKIVELLLFKFGTPQEAREKKLLKTSSQSNAEGLLPLHIVASSGNYWLVQLLLEYGADINQIDKLNKWSPVFYAVVKGYQRMTKTLIEYGADFTLKDEDNLDPLYYAIWEGNVPVLNVIIESTRSKKIKDEKNKSSQTKENEQIAKQLSLLASQSIPKPLSPTIDSNSIDMIPELSLPPPIIPLRKYGHNFLEKRIFLKLSFYTSRNSIYLNPNMFLTSIPGRITISCDKNDLIPRNILLPVLDNDKSITFQTDSLDEFFNIDFELFPTFGTRLLAKTTLSSSILKAGYPGVGSKLAGDLEIPLMDIRLRNVGFLRFNYEIVYPYSGIPLEISMYDTYWKSSSASDENDMEVKSISFVTSSSLNGEYHRVHVCLAHDGTPIVCPKFQVEVAQNVFLPVCLFNYDQLKTLVYKNGNELETICNDLKTFNNKLPQKNFQTIMKNVYLPLSDFLNIVNSKISLNLEIFYPSTYELEFYDMKCFTCISSKGSIQNKSTNEPINTLTNNTLNNFIDSILTDIFNHVRKLRSMSINRSRALILTSDNSTVCTILNWKQPNYPVFFNLNGVKYNQEEYKFYECTANGFHKDMVTKEAERDDKKLKGKLSIDNIDSINKDSTEYINSLDYEDKLSRSIKLAINYACSNNLLGITVSSKLLNLCPEMVNSIRSKGLVLVASKDDGISSSEDLITGLEDHANDDVDMNDGTVVIQTEIRDNSDTEISVNGLRFNDILSFKDAIDM